MNDDAAPMEAPPAEESNEEDSDVELEGKQKATEHAIERSRRNVECMPPSANARVVLGLSREHCE